MNFENYKKLCYLTSFVGKNWFDQMSNDLIGKRGFKDYLIELIKRTGFRVAEAITFGKLKKYFYNKRCSIISKNEYEVYLIISRENKRMLVKLIDILERDYRVVLWYWDSVSSGYTIDPTKLKLTS